MATAEYLSRNIVTDFPGVFGDFRRHFFGRIKIKNFDFKDTRASFVKIFPRI